MSFGPGVFYCDEEVDMAKDFAKGFYNSKAWQAVRLAYIKYRIGIDGGMCETCGNRPGYIVHHKEELTEENISNTNISLNFENFKYDCKFCHDREEGHFIKEKETRCGFDANGMPLPPIEK